MAPFADAASAPPAAAPAAEPVRRCPFGFGAVPARSDAAPSAGAAELIHLKACALGVLVRVGSGVGI